MASTDFADTADSASTSSIRRAVSAGYPIPNGGGTFARGMKSIVSGAAAVAQYATITGFAPSSASKGGWISAAFQRGLSSGLTGFSPFIFICLGGTTNVSNAYILGLGDADPSHFILRKGDLATGCPDVAPGNQGVLRRSTNTYAVETYYHLKLEAVVNGTGDVVLNVYQNNLNAHTVSSPTWTSVTGMSQLIDDAAGINTGSVPYTSGYFGYGFRSDQIGRVVYFDHIAMAVQN